MAIDFSYLEDAAPQKEGTPIKYDTVNVTMRVDADSFLHCDSEFVDIQLKAGVITKTQLPRGKHLLEFISLEAPNIKVEKVVDFPEAGKNYLVLISDLSKCIEAKNKTEALKKVEPEASEGDTKLIATNEAKHKVAEEVKRKAEEEAKRLEELKTTINGHKFVDLGLPSGLKWATCNVGASSPEECGDYYAWGEVKTKSSYTEENSVNYRKHLSDISGDSTYDVARKKWGASWRIPTYEEFNELMDKCKLQEIIQGGMNGYKVTGPNGNSIFLPAAGRREESWLKHKGKHVGYWSATPSGRFGDNTFAYSLEHFFNPIVSDCSRYYGYSVRPVSK